MFNHFVEVKLSEKLEFHWYLSTSYAQMKPMSEAF